MIDLSAGDRPLFGIRQSGTARGGALRQPA